MTDTLTRDEKRHALNVIRMDDFSDPYGAAMGHMFAIADVLHHTVGTPADWKYRHSPINDDAGLSHIIDDQDWPDSEYVYYADGRAGIAMLTYAGRVMDRYLRFVRRAGRGY